MTFKDKYGPWAVVAGASEGLGAALAVGAAARGCNVVLIARGESKLVEVATTIERSYGVSARPLALDLSATDAASRVVAAVDDLDVGFFVYNAAAEPMGRFLETPNDELVRNVHMNCTVPTLITKALAAKMVARGGGGIALCSSGAALVGARNIAAYGASKAYELILAEGLWEELRGSGVDVMGYVIGMTLTPSFRRNRGVTPQLEVELRAMGAQSPEECATQFYEVFGGGPRGYALNGYAAKFAADAARPRADVVAELGEMMEADYG